MADVVDVRDSRGIVMDKREMKKHILYYALSEYEELVSQRRSLIMIALDTDRLTEATRSRFQEVLEDMIAKAAVKSASAARSD